MIVLFTDFGTDGLYVGQMEAVLYEHVPGVKVTTLMNNAPRSDPRRSSYLLAATSKRFPAGVVFLCVVDPGVGGERLPVILRADDRWYVGPDNGLLNGVALAAEKSEWWLIKWLPENLSSSFHGRDLFAPVAARLTERRFPSDCVSWDGPEMTDWPLDVPEIVYIDHYGNAITGWRYRPELDEALLVCERHPPIRQARTFCSANPGTVFWYCNSIGLVEIAVNKGSAASIPGFALGSEFHFVNAGG